MAGRKAHSLEEELNIPRNAISAMKKDKLPKPETLAMLIEPERINLDWLIAGEGPPFQVIHPVDQAEARQEITDTLAYHSDADVYYATNNGRRAAIITYSVVKQYPGEKSVAFGGVRVIAGIEKSTSLLTDVGQHLAFVLPLNSVEFNDLVGGKTGNQDIFRWLHRGESIDPPTSHVQDIAGEDSNSIDANKERELLALFRSLDDEKQRQALELVRVISG